MADQSGNGKAGKKGPSGRSYRNATGLTRQPKKMRGTQSLVAALVDAPAE
jgi:hypothetical protein